MSAAVQAIQRSHIPESIKPSGFFVNSVNIHLPPKINLYFCLTAILHPPDLPYIVYNTSRRPQIDLLHGARL